MESWKKKKWIEARAVAADMFGGGVECAVITVGIVWHEVLVDILLELRAIHETLTDGHMKVKTKKDS